MATSGSFSITAGKEGWGTETMTFSWTRSSYEQGNSPSSTISWNVTFSTTGSYWKRESYSVSINGTAVSGTSGTTTISHSSNGTGSFTATITLKGYTERVGTIPLMQYEKSDNKTYTLDQLVVPASLLTASNFNDEENFEITYSNPSGQALTDLRLEVRSSNGELLVTRTSVPTMVNSYIPVLTDSERATLRKLVKTGFSTTIYYYLISTIDGIDYENRLIRTFTLINYLPTLSPTVVDTYSPTVALTGDSSKFVRYFSNAYFNTGATGKKEATITYQTIACGSQILEDYTSNTGTFENIDSDAFYFVATDSRGYTVNDVLVVDLIPYVKLTAALTLQPLTLAGDLSFIIEGNYYNNSFGAQDNSLQFEYQIKKDGVVVVPQSDGTWAEPSGEQSGWTIIEPSITYTDNKYEASYSLSGLDPNSTYTITAYVIDALMNVYSKSATVVSTPIFDWGKNDFKHNTPVYLTRNMSLRTIDNDGNDVSVFNPCNPNGNLMIGWGQYDHANGATNIYGNTVNLYSNAGVSINGAPVGGRVLWQGVYTMNASQTVTLSSPVSKQLNGIVLVFSLYTDGAAQDASFNTFFVSKKEVELLPAMPHNFFMMINSGFSVIGAKYLYISDSVITGHDTNSTAGTNNNMTFANNRFVLRYVIGV